MIQNYKPYCLIIAPLAVLVTLLLLPANYFDEGSPTCLSVIAFDIECYGCGMTRAIMHLIHFNFQEAFYYHPFSFPVVLVGGYLYVAYILKFWKKNRQIRS
ncbi:MAG: DUF2752 domain-containing protein [Bacteroidota bacterium]